MEIREMTIEELNARKLEIRSLLDSEDADLDALETEARSINEELETRANAEAKKEEIRKAVANAELPTEIIEKEEREIMENIEVRNSEAYVKAFANYIKTNDDSECRALLTENAPNNGQLPVPELVYGIVKRAWEKEGIFKRVKKSYLKGNLKVGVEISADAAVVHNEGADAPSVENLVIGIVELVPKSIKKWITISDEALDLDGAAFLEYVYEEVAYQIAKKAANELIDKITACGTVSTTSPTTSLAVPVISTASITLGLVASAVAQLSDSAANPIVMMNKATWANFKAVQYAANFAADPFEGLPVEFNNHITSFDAATTGVPFCIIGDLGEGALANLPNGQEIKFTFDDKSLAESDLVKIVGREYVGMGVVAPKHFVKITK